MPVHGDQGGLLARFSESLAGSHQSPAGTPRGLREAVASQETLLFGFRPGMSLMPKEFMAADPDYWTPEGARGATEAGGETVRGAGHVKARHAGVAFAHIPWER